MYLIGWFFFVGLGNQFFFCVCCLCCCCCQNRLGIIVIVAGRKMTVQNFVWVSGG
uniref:Uncharacterized protein n=1 Tax=Octopus bimaculoides TaxID=37653 RepID=A0A0L8H8Y9_OCTBM